jgi:dipeptidyl aminopeptidase/acylaminoacyl peptidase
MTEMGRLADGLTPPVLKAVNHCRASAETHDRSINPGKRTNLASPFTVNWEQIMPGISIASLFAGTEISEFDIHPDGTTAICSVNRGRNWELATLDLRTGRLARFLSAEQSLVTPRYSPDGSWLVYETDFQGDEDHDLVIVNSASKEQRKITDGVADNFNPAVSPSGDRIAFLSNRKADIENIYLISPKGGKLAELTHEELPVRDLAWSPDGNTIAYHTGIGDEDTVSIVDMDRRKSRLLLARKNVEYALTSGYGDPKPWSKDGKSLVFVSNENDSVDIGSIDLRTRKRRWVVKSKNEKYEPRWSPDGSSLAYLEVDDPNLVVKIKTGARTRIVSPKDGLSRRIRWSPDGRRLYFVNGSANRKEEFYAASTKPKVVSSLHAVSPPKALLSYPKLIKYKSFDDRKIPALLFMPKDRLRRAGVVLPHGGPEAQTLNEWDQLVHMLNAKGFVVIEPNYRGSTGYGRRFLHLHDKDLGGGDYLDTVYAGKHLLDAGLVDDDRLGYWGASYSGFTCMLALTKHPEMWAAGVSIVGFFDWETEIANERGYLQAYDHKKMGDPKKDPEFFRERSPIHFLQHLKAPLLMTASSQDVRCPPTEARAVVERLKELGKRHEYHEYADEGHWPRKRKNLRDLYERSTRFLDRNIPK